MSSQLGLPARGSNITVLITEVHSSPNSPLVEFWGKLNQVRTLDHQSLSPVNLFQELEGNPGDLCLVKINLTWYRCRIVSRNGSNCKVFLIDEGITFITTTKLLAWGKLEHFHLPPEAERCVLANVLPLSPENRWSPGAIEFLKYLRGRESEAHVQDVLVQQKKLILDIPCISRQMYEMGLAKKLGSSWFLDVVKASDPHSSGKMSPAALPIPIGEVEQLQNKELYMYPQLLAGAVETVVVTEVTNPQRVFCQLKVFSHELKKLSEQITQCCIGRTASCSVGPEMIGFPCAARGSDGRWCRSVLQQVLPTNDLVEVLNVDLGTKQFVQMENVRPLAPEFFRMPVVTYLCSLNGIIDRGVGWTSTQIDYLKTLLLHKTLIAKFEYQGISEGVYYVTLYGDENKNLNNLFSSKESSLHESEKTLHNYAIGNASYSSPHPFQLKNNEGKLLLSGQTLGDGERMNMFSVENLLPNSSHMAWVAHVCNPSEFWIQTQNHAKELDKLMDKMHHLYQHSDNKDVIETPTVGTYCAAKADDGVFYRAVVSEVGKAHIKVFFVDYGDTKEVDGRNIRTLPDIFKELPKLALKCALVGVCPKGHTWSCFAIEYFSKIATDKILKVYVMAKRDDTHLVTLTNSEASGEKDISQMLCSSGLAERDEKPPNISTHNSKAGCSGVYKNSVASFQTQSIFDISNKEKQIDKFKACMFPIGSVLDVNVSYINSPNDFWCQLAQNAVHLKLLMQDMQAYYAGSEFEPLTERSCVACHPDNRMWYRALVIHNYKTPLVDVLFVDYGQTRAVSLYELRRICPEFLQLQGQAFRCSLFNPLEAMSVVNEWNEEAKETFHNFVETASTNILPLKCTVYAVMYNEQKIVFNMVDLETPFESICTIMANLAKVEPAKKDPGSSFRLDTFYYSTHNIKTGTEEQVTVTCVVSVNQFYCQLEKNADVIKDLKVKVNDLCQQLARVKTPTVFGTLCFAKYTDGLWYRAQVKATRPSVLVHFVDYGDTTEVAKSDLLPVPKEAYDIMSVPVQAVVCCLSDVPADVPSEVNGWFTTTATECKFSALVVAKEPNGNLLVELYRKEIQINSKLKKIFQIESQIEGKVIYEGRKVETPTANKVPKTTFSPEAMPVPPKTIRKLMLEPKPAHQVRSEQVRSEMLTSKQNSQNGPRVKASSKEMYLPPHLRQHYDGQMIKKPRQEHLIVANNSKHSDSTLPSKESDNVLPQAKNPQRPKLKDIPKNSLPSGMEADVYVSHYNSPLSFYVQLVRDEDNIFSLVDKLNDSLSTPKISLAGVAAGEVVKAQFAGDSLWYRAVVREVLSNSMALVEFIDFGNTAQLSTSQIANLDKEFVQLPRYSTHCMLSGCGSLELLDAEVVQTLKRDMGSNAEKKLNCQFVQLSEDVWEVTLVDNGVQIRCDAPSRCPKISPDFEHVVKKSAQNPETSLKSCYLYYHPMNFKVGQQLPVYISAVCDAQSFWCQSLDSVELDKLSESLSEIGNAESNEHVSISTLSPGTPCVALFAEDQLWCRAEVLNKNGRELSVLFVDYGNTSQVTDSNVREITDDLLTTPPQAFLCKLEGFDVCRGSWCDGAVDELISITADKLLQMTITKISSDDGKDTCFVQLECEGLMINEKMKTWWVSSTPDDKQNVAQSSLDERQQSTDPTEKVSKDEAPELEEIGVNGARTERHVTNDLLMTVTRTSEHIENSVEDTSVISPESPLEQRHLSESQSPNERVNVVPTPERNILFNDIGIEENKLLLQIIAENVGESDQNYDEESASVMQTTWPGEITSPDQSLQKASDESVLSTSQFKDWAACNMSASSEVMSYSVAQNKASNDCNLTNSSPITSGMSMKMVPCYDLVAVLKEMNNMTTSDETLEVSKENTYSDVPDDSRPIFTDVEAMHRAEEAMHRTEEAVQSTEEAVQSTEEAVHGTEEPVHRTEEAVQPTEEAMYRTEEAVHPTEEVVHPTEEAVHLTEEAVHPTEEAVHPTEEAVHPTEEAVHRTGEAVHPTEEAVHHTGEAVRRTGEAVRRTGEAVRRTEEAMHATEEAVHPTEGAVHPTEEAMHPTEEAINPAEGATLADSCGLSDDGVTTDSNDCCIGVAEEETNNMTTSDETLEVSKENTYSDVPDDSRPIFKDEAMHRAEEAMHRAEEAMHHTEEAVHATEEAMHATEEAMHATEEAVHPTEEAVHPTEEAVHPTEEAVHPTEEAVHPTEEAVHPTEEARHPAEGATLADSCGLSDDGATTDSNDCCIGVAEEETDCSSRMTVELLSSADDCSDVCLPNVIHLSLVVNEGCEDGRR
ncbi:tudor domain-containing 6 isoform X3 [Entelurus aequoreus]|uniref:tudor domain-containing 6 isoform X3 n=1 Tax=Entelurus aequoreus TaxID=161455 RepID=UPI002B1E73F0|nr:tudor domain-containing 6 isoform X3 [Entelurus aequoreus]